MSSVAFVFNAGVLASAPSKRKRGGKTCGRNAGRETTTWHPTRSIQATTQATTNKAAEAASNGDGDGCEPTATRDDWLLTDATVCKIVRGTMLEDKRLQRVYNSDVHGFSNTSFFETMIPMNGVPSLVLGRTRNGAMFGGYTAHGFAARDDYRETANPLGLFVFAVRDDGEVVVAQRGDGVLYDFYDFAIRFGSDLLAIPMNPAKHGMKADAARSCCVMGDGSSSVFGDATMATLERVEVLVASEYVDGVGGAGDAKKGKRSWVGSMLGGFGRRRG